MKPVLKFFRNLFVPLPSPKVIEEREQLYTRYFGASPTIYHSTNKVFPHIDVYHFEPSEKRPFHTLITGGMADYQQPVEGLSSPSRLELIAYARTIQSWAAGLLKLIAEYPAQNNTFFSAYHTVPIGSPITDTSQITAFFLAPPEIEDLSLLSFSIADEPVDYLACVPITTAEHAFAQNVGSEQLFQRLKEADLLVHGDDERRSIVD